ncbi:MAG: SRPBCC family protein [Pseudonocardia sp.]
MSGAGEVADRIEREILIDAPLERVWRLVSEPGWWIGDGERSGQVVSREGDLVVVDYPPHGRFPVLPVTTHAPHYVAYRAAEDPGQTLAEGTSTLVEFFLAEKDGGTLLRVVESGFASLYSSAERRAAAVEDNIEGWEMQLGFAKRDAERAPA